MSFNDKSHDAICDFCHGWPVTRASCDKRVLALIINLRCLALFAETREDVTSLFYFGDASHCYSYALFIAYDVISALQIAATRA